MHTLRTAIPALVLLAPAVAAAQTELRAPAPPAPVEGEYEGAESVLWNPALLADAPTWQVTYLHRQQLGDTRLGAGAQGDAFLFASPVIGPLALAGGFAVGYPADTFDFEDAESSDRLWGMVALGAAFRLHPSLALGLLYRGYLADTDEHIDGLNTLDAGFTFRPWRWMGLSFAAADLFEPRSGTSREWLVPWERRYLVDLSFRPFGDDVLTVGVSMRAGEVSRRIWLGGGLAVRPVEGLAIRGRFDARLDECGGAECFADWQVGTALEVAFPFAAVGGGVGVFENGGAVDAVDVVARISGAERPSVDRPDRVVAFRWTGGLSGPDWLSLAEWSAALRRDGDAVGVLLVLDGFAGSTADAQQVRREIASLQAAGKTVWCSYDDAGSAAAYACSAADRTVVAPGGGARLTGLRTRLVFFRRLLERLGVQAQIVRVGAYKSAPESFTEDSPTPEHEEALGAYLDDVYASLTEDVAADQGLADAAAAAALIDRGPFTSAELLEVGVADEVAFADEAEDAVEEATDASLIWADLDDPPPGDGSLSWSRRPRVAVVRIDGSLIDGKTIAIPGIGVRFIGDRTVVEILDRLRTDSSVAAVVLEIDSGGGSAVASDNIWRAAMRVRGVKPVVAAIGGIGASGAYYVASAAREIFVLPATLTGSIGIFYGKADVGDLLLSLGVNTFEEQRGARATMESWSRPYTEDEIAVLEEKIAFYYGQFLDRVAQGRAGKLTREEVDAAGQGRIWSGVRAVELGLADRVGGLGEAIARARALAGLPDDAPAVDAEPPKGGLVDILLGALTAADDAPAAEGSADLLPFVLRAVDLDGTLAALAPFLALDAATPMALLPYVLEADVE